MIGIAAGAMCVFMAALWFVQRAFRNAGLVDVAWSFGTAGAAAFFAWGAEGDADRRLLVGALAGAWGLRLGFYLLMRVTGEAEDGRYQRLRELWGERADRNLFWFFQLQASWAILFALPMLFAAMNPEAGLRWYDFAGAGVWLVAMIGETWADRTLARFRSDPANRGRVCRVGMWGWSRHPNYFFEWIHWWAYVLIGLGGDWFPATFFGPALMLLFLFKITGIPPTEQRALLSRPDEYRKYQREVSVFVPLPPRLDPPG